MLTCLSRWRLTSSEKVQGYTLEVSWKIFCNSLNTLKAYKSPKTLSYIQYRLLCVTQATYRAIKVIYEPWKSPKDVLMRRPATYFATYFNWLASSNLPKTLNYIQYRLLCVTQVPYHAINLIFKPWKNSLGRPNETSCNIFCNSFKLIGVYKSPKNIESYTIQGIICHPGAISRNKSDQWVLKKSQGRPNETSCNIFCNRFKQIDLCKSGSLSIDHDIKMDVLIRTKYGVRIISYLHHMWCR